MADRLVHGIKHPARLPDRRGAQNKPGHRPSHGHPASAVLTWAATGRQCPHRSIGCQIRHGRQSNRACQSSSPDHAGWMIARLYPALSICSCAARLGTAAHAIMEWPGQSMSAGANGTEGGFGLIFSRRSPTRSGPARRRVSMRIILLIITTFKRLVMLEGGCVSTRVRR